VITEFELACIYCPYHK